MKTTQTIIALVLVAVIGVWFAGAVAAQESKTVTVAGILEKAKCPLTEEQAKKLKEFKPGGDRAAFRAIYEVFDEKQTAALKKALGTSPGRNNGPERPRGLNVMVLFENAGCPLTEDQVAKLKAVTAAGRDAMAERQKIYNEKQNEIVQSMFSRQN
jgi:hypothetical protein